MVLPVWIRADMQPRDWSESGKVRTIERRRGRYWSGFSSCLLPLAYQGRAG